MPPDWKTVFRVTVILAFVAVFVARNYLHGEYMRYGAASRTSEHSVSSKGAGYGVRYITDSQNRRLQLLWYGQFGLVALAAGVETLLRKTKKSRDADDPA